MRGPAWRRLALVVALATGVPGATLQAQPATGEAEAKARFTLTLARFVQWPASGAVVDGAPLQLCVMHNSPAVAAAFASQHGVVVAGHPLHVNTGAIAPGALCDVLFVDGSAARAAAQPFLLTAERPMLTLGAVDGFLSQGGMVELVNVNDALRFDINLKALRRAHLGLSGQVLKLARQVRE
jgi:hypothetical protein